MGYRGRPYDPQEDLSLTLCPGHRGYVMRKGINPATGQCKRCTPVAEPVAPPPSSRPNLESRPVRSNPSLPSGLVPVEATSSPARLEIRIPPRPIVEFLPRREVDEWLYSLLKGKTVLVVEIRREAAARGYSWPRVKRAKERLGIESEKLEWREGWAWHLPFPD